MLHQQRLIGAGVWALGAASVLACAPSARAQEAMYTAAATMPSPGTGTFRPQMHWFQYGTNPLDPSVEKTQGAKLDLGLAYGLGRSVALFVDVPLVTSREDRAGSDDWDHGVEDIDAMVKWRIYKHDSGGIDTVRAALMAGAKVASGDDKDYSSQSINPHIGAVLTIVRGRHGFNQELSYKWNTGGTKLNNLGGDGPDDLVTFNSAYVYRFYPDAFTSESTGGWYVTAEVNGLYETNGDVELRWSPGIMYEGRVVSFEAMAQFPLWHDLSERPELDLTFGIGVRVTF